MSMNFIVIFCFQFSIRSFSHFLSHPFSRLDPSFQRVFACKDSFRYSRERASQSLPKNRQKLEKSQNQLRLPETFELVHMIIFSVMLVYVSQAGVLMSRCDHILKFINRAEHISTWGMESIDSLESYLRKDGYIMSDYASLNRNKSKICKNKIAIVLRYL